MSVNSVFFSFSIGNASFGTVCAGDSKFSFPWIIQTFGLHCYDFFKVLESFIKAEPILTKEIVKVTNVILYTFLSCFMYLKEFCFQMFGISFVALTKFGEKDFRRAGMDPSKYKVDLGHKNVNSHFNFELIQT